MTRNVFLVLVWSPNGITVVLYVYFLKELIFSSREDTKYALILELFILSASKHLTDALGHE